MIYVYILLFIVIACLIFLPKNWEGLIPFLRRLLAGQSAQSLDVKSKEHLIDKTLRSLSCEPIWEDEGNDRKARFDYQNGHFLLRIERGKTFVNLSYLFFFSTSMENLQLVRSLCNQVNMNSEQERIVYSLNEEKNEIDLHALIGFTPQKEGLTEVLKYVLSNVFGWQNAFIRRFNEVIDEHKNAEGGDKEQADAEWMRELFLLRQQELLHQPVGEVREQEDNRLTIAPLVKNVMGIEGFAPTELIVEGKAQETISDKEQIASYNLSSSIIADNKFSTEESVLRLHYFDLRQPDVRRQMTIHLKAEKEDGKSLYYRATITLIPLSVDKDVPMRTMSNQPIVNSVLVAYDLVNPKQRTDEFLYMWKEAQEKQKNGEEDTLTDEQRFICDCMDRHVAENLYRGRQLYLSEQYYEALYYLESAYKELAPYYDVMKSVVKEKFYDLCYYIGFCHTELKQYKQAYYYLDIISGLRRITYTTELVNCMVNSGDVRALSYIDQLMTQMRMENELNDEDEEPQEHITKFMNFLKRRQAYLLIERRQYNKAKTILNELLDDPESSDFAINELAFIQKQNDDQSTDTSPDLPF